MNRRSNAAAPAPVGGGVWVEQKIGNGIFQTRQIQHLHIEFRNESQMALLWRQNGGGNSRQGSHKQFVVCPQLKGATCTNMAKMPDCCMCSQQFTIKHGVRRLHVGQISGKEIKWSPMVPRFLLHDAAAMSIEDISGKRKFRMWDRMLEGYRRSQEAFCILESLLCGGGPLQSLGPLHQEIS
jgi:hypothetical protein